MGQPQLDIGAIGPQELQMTSPTQKSLAVILPALAVASILVIVSLISGSGQDKPVRATHEDVAVSLDESVASEPTLAIRDAQKGDEFIIDSVVDERFVVTVPDDTMSDAERDVAFRHFTTFLGTTEFDAPDLQVFGGNLTLPVGAGTPDEFTAKDQPVYAFVSGECAPRHVSPGDAGDDSTQPDECTQWVFLDAESGALVDLTWSS